MKAIRWIVLVLLVAGCALAFMGWKKAQQTGVENAALRAELQALKEQTAAEAESLSQQRENELQRLRADAQEVQKLRSEVSQLRTGSKEIDKLRAENQRLRTAAASPTSTQPAAPAPAAAPADQFPRENWAFAGYATPEAALISAVWAMREGNTKTYLDSLSPDEQLRMAKTWENKPEAEVAAKHKQDVAAITGVRILERQQISPDEVQMNVYVEGVQRVERVAVHRVNNEWKFGGFKRSPAPQP